MGRLLFVIFLLVPLVEIGLFISLGQLIGLWPTLLGVVLTALIGSAIIRVQGLSLLAEIQRTSAAGILPAQQLAEGMMIGIAGALLLTPGYFTDLCGFLLLVPAVRIFIYAQLKARINIVSTGTNGPGFARPSATDDPNVVDLDDDDWHAER